jgi:hypothetical protein
LRRLISDDFEGGRLHSAIGGFGCEAIAFHQIDLSQCALSSVIGLEAALASFQISIFVRLAKSAIDGGC